MRDAVRILTLTGGNRRRREQQWERYVLDTQQEHRFIALGLSLEQYAEQLFQQFFLRCVVKVGEYLRLQLAWQQQETQHPLLLVVEVAGAAVHQDVVESASSARRASNPGRSTLAETLGVSA